MTVPERGYRSTHRSCKELQAAAAVTTVADGRINDLVNNALGYLEKYRDGLPKGLREASYMDYCRALYLLFEVIPTHPDFPAFSSKKKHSAFYESYETLKTLVETDKDITDLEQWLQDHAKVPFTNSRLEKSDASIQEMPSIPRRTSASKNFVPNGDSDLVARFERLRSSTNARSPVASKASSVQKSSDDDNQYSNHLDSSTTSEVFSTNGYVQPALSAAPVIFPKSTVINTEKLHYFLQHAPDQILVLDIRSRADFNRGHINIAPNIVCIEPVSLRDGMNDEDLEDTLVIAPEKEQEIFSRRNKFELVVYYDWDSRTNSHRGGPTSDQQQLTLYYLARSIYQYAFSKVLKRPPCLLIGGYEAWMDDIHDLNVKTPRASNEGHANNFTPPLPRPPSSDIISRPQNATRKGSFAAATTPQTGYVRDINEYFRAIPSYKQQGSYSPHTPHASYHNEEPTSPVASPKPVLRSSSFSTDTTGGSIGSISSIIDVHSHSLSQSTSNTQRAPPSYPPPLPPTASVVPNTSSRQNSAPPQHWYDHQLQEQEEERYREHWKQVQQQERHAQLWSAASEFTTGLKNLGNTCYMNCIIQCLAGTPSISVPFVDGSYKRWVNVQSKLGYKGVLAQKFAELVQTLIQQKVVCVGPIALKELSGRLRNQFSGFEQQDAQEFLTFILDGLHEDLNSNGNKERLKELTTAEEARREHMSVRVASTIEWERYLKSDFSLIVDTCQGQYQSKLRCLTCGHSSTTYNAFSFLSLPIPLNKRGGPVSIIDCFNLFTAEEILDGDDAWFCPKCKKPRRTSKRLCISRLPSILIVHLKRFHYRYDGSADKLETFITFPTSASLDLTPYWPPYTGDDEAKLSKLPIRGQTAPFIYNLYAVANHFGTLKGGHYTAFVKKGRSGWCLFDDGRISKNIHPDHVMTRHAYVLFFQRQQTHA